MTTKASQITSLTVVYLIFYSDADQWKHQSSASLTCEFPAQRASNAENISIWWRHHDNRRVSERHLNYDAPQFTISMTQYKTAVSPVR